MAAGNLVVKLMLDSGAFDTNIKSAKAQIQGLENVGKNIASVIGKFATAIGITTTAVETFNKIMRSSQTTSDWLDQQMRVLTNSVDGFFTAISTGDFSYMSRGFEEIKRKAKEAQQAIDQLGNTTMSYNYFTSKNDVAFADALQKAKDKTLDKDTREAAKATATAIIGEQSEISEVMSQTLDETMRKLVTENIGGLNWLQVGKTDIERIIQLDVLKKRDSEKARLEKEYEEYKSIMQEAKDWVQKNRHYKDEYGRQNRIKEYFRDIKGTSLDEVTSKYKDAILANEMLVKKNDAWLEDVIKIAKEYDNVMRKIVTMKQQMNKVNGMDLSKGVVTSTTTSSTKKIDPAVEGSLRELDEKIKAVQDKMNNINLEVNPDDYQKCQNELKELEATRYVLITPKLSSGSVISDSTRITTIDPTTAKLPSVIPELPTNEYYTENIVTANEQWQASLNGVASALGAVTNLTNEGASAWISWGAGILTSVAAALPALTTLFAAETAVGAASAAKSAAETPVVGWILAGAAVASFLAAVAAIPKFADGGIINSPFTSGDKVLARVNGGEMILNKGQQANLFNLLNNGATAGANQVSFKISGKELVGVINNYNNRLAKAL